MTVLVVSDVAESLRGRISRWMIEIGPGVFVGRLSARVAQRIWELAVRETEEGWASLARSSNNEQGFLVRSHGDTRRTPKDFDGLVLMRFALEDRDGDGRVRGARMT